MMMTGEQFILHDTPLQSTRTMDHCSYTAIFGVAARCKCFKNLACSTHYAKKIKMTADTPILLLNPRESYVYCILNT
jgi:hypothetical protein